MLTHLGGIDHAVLLVRDLAAAGAGFARMGFTVAPRGTHSPHIGTGNHCVMLRGDYFELLGVLTPTPLNERWRQVLETGERVTAIALRAHDADAGAAEVAARGIPTLPVQAFGRPVEAIGRETRFRTFHLAEPVLPGMRLFACQHLTPEATWIPGLMDHANTAEGLDAVEVLAADPAGAAARLAAILDRPAVALADGTHRVETGAAPLLVLDAARLAARYPGVELAGLPQEGPVSLAFRVRDRSAAARCLAGLGAMEGPGGLALAQHGVILTFR